MRYQAAASLLLALTASLGFSQGSDSADPGRANHNGERVRIYSVGPAVTAPEILPVPFTESTSPNCSKKNKDVLRAEIALIVDSEGKPRNLYFVHATGKDLDRLALRVASADRFRPATLEDKPVAAWASLGMEFEVCVGRKKNAAGSKVETFQLLEPPKQTLKPGTQSTEEAIFAGDNPPENLNRPVLHIDAFKVGGGVTPPKPLSFPIAEFSEDARRKKISGVCVVSLVVDAQGMPQSPHIVKELYPSLDQKALEAISRYRFTPAMKGGLQPVPVTIAIEVNFRLY